MTMRLPQGMMQQGPFAGMQRPPQSPLQPQMGSGVNPAMSGFQRPQGGMQPMQAGMAPMGMHPGIGGGGFPMQAGMAQMGAGFGQLGQPGAGQMFRPPGGGLGLPPPPQAPQGGGFQPPPGQSLEQGALGGGGVDNKQQIQNFLQALQQSGAGGNNTFMGTPNPAQIPPQMTQGLNPNMFNPAMVQPQTRPAFGTAPQSAMFAAQQPQAAMPRMAPQVARPNPSMMMSDEEQKERVEPGTPDLKAFLDSLGAWNYRYKQPEVDGEGEYTSPMAQELEKTDLGKQAVIETPRGKMVDYARLGGVNLAAAAVVHRENLKLAQRIKTLEKQFRER